MTSYQLLGLGIQGLGAIGCLSFPIIAVMTFKKRYIIGFIISLIMLFTGFMIALPC